VISFDSRRKICATSDHEEVPVDLDDDDSETLNPQRYAATRLKHRQEFATLRDFIFHKKQAGLLTEAEDAQILSAALKIFFKAGVMKAEDSAISIAVQKQSNHLMRTSLLRFHPEWRDELAQALKDNERGR
jgi:hypothetical protein